MLAITPSLQATTLTPVVLALVAVSIVSLALITISVKSANAWKLSSTAIYSSVRLPNLELVPCSIEGQDIGVYKSFFLDIYLIVANKTNNPDITAAYLRVDYQQPQVKYCLVD